MELDILKNFVNRHVEVLVGGVWIDGHMTPIVKGVVTLLPVGEVAEFYGPTAMKHDIIQAVRQVKKQGVPAVVPPPPVAPDTTVRSSLDQVTPGQRFVSKK